MRNVDISHERGMVEVMIPSTKISLPKIDVAHIRGAKICCAKIEVFTIPKEAIGNINPDDVLNNTKNNVNKNILRNSGRYVDTCSI